MNDRGRKPRRTFLRHLKSTSKRTFVLYPLCIIALELVLRRGDLAFQPLGAPLLLWGYLQYRLVGDYRVKHGGGGPGLDNPPERIVSGGPYRFVRNPMYLGHLIFMLGLAVTFSSWAAAALLLFHVFWFDARARKDEAHLEALFGEPYLGYKSRVRRWIPGII